MDPMPVRVSEADRIVGCQWYVGQMFGQRIDARTAADLAEWLRGEPKQDAAMRHLDE